MKIDTDVYRLDFLEEIAVFRNGKWTIEFEDDTHVFGGATFRQSVDVARGMSEEERIAPATEATGEEST